MELKQLCEIHAPSGDEGQLRKLLLEEGKRLCGAENARIDRSGNVICTLKGTQPGKPHVCVSAHMEEVGVIIEAATGRFKKVHPLMWVVAALFVVYFLLDPIQMWLGIKPGM